MFANSRPILSDQRGVHPRLPALLQHHRESPLQRPISTEDHGVFRQVHTWAQAHGGPLLVDAGCGTGNSTAQLAARHDSALVIGLDRSARRLQRSGLHGRFTRRGNCILARLRLEDFFPLAAVAGWQVQGQYFFYPNPWPKQKHLGKRWYAGALFPWIMALGGRIELRCNWLISAREFVASVASYPGYHATLHNFDPGGTPISPFEQKYHASGQRLYRGIATPRLVTRNQTDWLLATNNHGNHLCTGHEPHTKQGFNWLI